MTAHRYARPALLAAAFAVVALVAAPAHATVALGTEDDVSGFVGELLTGYPGYATVASDGESEFDPFHAGYDISDGIQFGSFAASLWSQASDSTWTDLGNSTWVIPASDPGPGCGSENDNTCEMVGHWVTSPGVYWSDLSVLGDYVIYDSDGSVSDVITLFNTPVEGGELRAEITFQSSPIPVPEPASMLLLGSGLLGLARLRRRA